ncbi:MAG: amidohydrolase [Galactobacter sp.]
MDTLITNARVLTMDDAAPRSAHEGTARAESLAILNGSIVAVGQECTGLEYSRTVDAGGAVVVPGFNDAHAHSVWFGHTLIETNLAQCADLDDLYARIARAAADLEPGEWLVASGYNQMDTGGRYPDPDVLDRAAGGRPVWIKHTSGHSCIVNTAALSLLGIDGSERFEGGSVVVDATGRPTGVLEENAMALVQEHLLPAPQERIVSALDAATRAYATEGLTSVTDAGIGGGWIGHSPQEFAAYQVALERGLLRTRMQPMLVGDVLEDIALGGTGASFRGLPGGLRTGLGDDRVQLGPVKMFLDGSILGNTARMSQGYHNCPANHGYFQGDVDQMRARALAAGRSGWSLAMHAVGDEAIDVAIEILEQLNAEGITPVMPHRIEHGVVATPVQLDRLAELGAAIVTQPYFVHAYGDGFRGYIGDTQAQVSYGLRSMLEHGLILAGSSDRPVADGKPLYAMQAAVQRLTESGWVYGEDERITAIEALRAYTVGSAEVTGWAGRKGRLAPGYLADLTILSDDPTMVDPSRIGGIDVLATVVGGEVTHDPHGLWDTAGLSEGGAR